MNNKEIYYFFILIFLISCGGGGGNSPIIDTPEESTTPTNTTVENISVTLSSSANSVEINSSITLSWSSTYAESCQASGSWSGIKGTSGSETIIISDDDIYRFNLSCSANGANSGSASTIVNILKYLSIKF